MNDYLTYYASIEKPLFAPEPWVYGVAWGIIYPLIFIALFYSIYLEHKWRLSTIFLYVFIANLIFNFAFTPLLFGAKSILWATVDILLVLGTLVWLERQAWQRNKIIFWLLAPYFVWGTFATVLQVTILVLNR